MLALFPPVVSATWQAVGLEEMRAFRLLSVPGIPFLPSTRDCLLVSRGPSLSTTRRILSLFSFHNKNGCLLFPSLLFLFRIVAFLVLSFSLFRGYESFFLLLSEVVRAVLFPFPAKDQ